MFLFFVLNFQNCFVTVYLPGRVGMEEGKKRQIAIKDTYEKINKNTKNLKEIFKG